MATSYTVSVEKNLENFTVTFAVPVIKHNKRRLVVSDTYQDEVRKMSDCNMLLVLELSEK